MVKTISDVDSIPVLSFYSRNGQSDSIVYIRFNDKKINVNCDIEFIGGWKSMDAFCDSLYYNRKSYNNQELNAYFLYSILFDNKLHIRDIHIYKGISGYRGEYDYNEMVKQILKRTAGKWQLKTKPSKTWHLYIGSHKFM
jgi:hypothetical protein